MLTDWVPEQPLSQVTAHPRHLWLGRGRAGSQDLIIVAWPTPCGPTLTPVFVAGNCWGRKKTVLEGVRSHQARVTVVSRAVTLAPPPAPPPPHPPRAVAGGLLESRSKHGRGLSLGESTVSTPSPPPAVSGLFRVPSFPTFQEVAPAPSTRGS